MQLFIKSTFWNSLINEYNYWIQLDLIGVEILKLIGVTGIIKLIIVITGIYCI